ncbi:hypothetical protein GYMLUDRAFT_262906 [Collybiopsis luxurians FD-317 M1]|uniref:Proteasome assembly chaperone 3 n=1 Tax=Collybiopsis luxurians FD-317 M1 TaxID=944289 RepID=A0A0D0CHK4_9AGAR|nr:hypothetical protein GYMLUDRAFT_262906 [Collybiopsis luxurians FD-317 M1]
MPSSTKTLQGTHTDISIQHYADSVLVIVTQMGKVGNLVQVSLPATVPVTPSAPDPLQPNLPKLPSPPIAIQLVPLLGAASSDHVQTLHNLYASQIATIVWLADSESPLQVSRKKVIVGIALRKSGENGESELSEAERVTFYGVMSALQELLHQD